MLFEGIEKQGTLPQVIARDAAGGISDLARAARRGAFALVIGAVCAFTLAMVVAIVV